ncbi:MAG: guanylate kinase [Candidatus Parcubacteria bacterium]|jgi:guanylate kinase
MKNGSITVISGPSGVGKDTVIRHLVKRHGYRRAVSFTTREPRTGEVDGQDYHFVPEQTFLDMHAAGEFIDHAVVTGKHYALAHRTLNWHCQFGAPVVVNAVIETGFLLRHAYEDVRLVFIRPPSMESLMERLVSRGMSATEIAARFREKPLQCTPPVTYDLVITNEDGLDAEAADIIAQHAVPFRLQCGA